MGAQSGLRQAITGVAGGEINSDSSQTYRVLTVPENSTIALKNTTLDDVIIAASSSSTVSLSGCTCRASTYVSMLQNGQRYLTNCVLGSTTITGKVDGDHCRFDATNCTMNAHVLGANGVGNEDRHAFLFKTCVINSNIYLYSRKKCIVTGGTITNHGSVAIQGGSYKDQKIVLSGNIKMLGAITCLNNDNTTEITYLIAGSTINCTGNGRTTVLMGCAADGLQVGTFSDATNLTGTWTTGGTATIITATGTTVKVSGTGTYINKDGTTDLTVVP